MGAGELGGAYFPIYASRLASTADAPRFVSMLTLAATVASFAPVVVRSITERFGFPASFVLGMLFAIAGAVLVSRIGRVEIS